MPLLSMVIGFVGSFAGRPGATIISAIECPLAPGGGGIRVGSDRAGCTFGLLLRVPRRERKHSGWSTAHPYRRKTPWSPNRHGASWLHDVEYTDRCAFEVCRSFPGCAPGRMSLAAHLCGAKSCRGLVYLIVSIRYISAQCLKLWDCPEKPRCEGFDGSYDPARPSLRGLIAECDPCVVAGRVFWS
jgi:hypothetical protein